MKPQPAATLNAARILGPLMIISGAALITQHARMISVIDAVIENDAFALMAGFVTVLLALLLLALHDYWRGFTQALISVLGWLALLRGVTLIFAPQIAHTMGVFVISHPLILPVAGCGVVFLGLWLVAVGFLAPPESEALYEPESRKR